MLVRNLKLKVNWRDVYQIAGQPDPGNRPIRRSAMKLATALIVFARLFCVENRMLSKSYKRDVATAYEESTLRSLRYPIFNFATEPISMEDEYENDKDLTLKPTEKEEIDSDENEHLTKRFLEKLLEPCAIVVRSNMNSAMQSVLRKYTYDATGALIPSSVRYFMKVPQGYGAPVLVPLNDKSVSHLGGYVRYYKEVPPIPQAL